MQSVTIDALSVGTLGQDRRLEVFKGDSLQLAVPVRNADGTPYAELVDCVVKWRVAYGSLADDVVVLEMGSLAPETGITLDAGGIATIDITAADSELLPVGPYYHEMKLTKDADVLTTMNGMFLVKRHLPIA